MTKLISFFVLTFFSIINCFLFAADLNFSGVFDSTVNYTAGAGGDHSWGIEEYANIRLRLRIGDKAVFNAAFNVAALSGNFLEAAKYLASSNPDSVLGSTPFIYGDNYAMGIELERLYFRINGDLFDTEAGLLRMNFGYGMVWRSSDFLNPRNPLAYNARPRGVLGANFSFYPTDTLKLLFFAAAPKNPLESDGGGFIPGLALDQHWDRASVQALYAYETPLAGSDLGLHRFGLSLKADLELGFVVDALYILNPEKPGGIDGLSAGAGFDYNFFDGDLYIMAEYLYNGASSVTAFDNPNNLAGRKNRHYLSASGLYRFNDYSSFTLTAVLCFDDLSFQPVAGFDYEFFQSFSMNLSCFVPLDRKALGGDRAGELGPEESRAKAIVNAAFRLRF